MGGHKVRLVSILVALLAVALFTGMAQRTERQAIAPLDEVLAYPEPLADWLEPAEYLAKCAWGEARSESPTRQAAVMWCVLNRVDDPRFPDDVVSVVTQPTQFFGYHRINPTEPELYDLALDVLVRWQAEHAGCEDVGRVLPREYVYFTGRGGVNYYGTEYHARYGMVGPEWDWSLESPYDGGMST